MLLLFNCLQAQANEEFIEDYLDIASGYAVSGNYDKAINYLDKVLNIDEDNVKALQIKSTLINIHTYNYDDFYSEETPIALELEENLEETTLENYDNALSKFLKAKELYEVREYSMAKTKFEELSLQYRTAEIYKYIGLCDDKLNLNQDALLNLNKSIILFDEDNETKTKYDELKEFMEMKYEQ